MFLSCEKFAFLQARQTGITVRGWSPQALKTKLSRLFWFHCLPQILLVRFQVVPNGKISMTDRQLHDTLSSLSKVTETLASQRHSNRPSPTVHRHRGAFQKQNSIVTSCKIWVPLLTSYPQPLAHSRHLYLNWGFPYLHMLIPELALSCLLCSMNCLFSSPITKSAFRKATSPGFYFFFTS